MAKPPAKGHNAKPAVAAPTPEADAKPADAKPADGDGADGSGAQGDGINVPHILGPKLVDLGHGAEINVPAGMFLFEKETAQRILREDGNDVENTVAAIGKPGAKWLVVIDAEDIGYVSDDDADELDADAFLKSFQDGTAAQNKDRVAQGIPELFVDGWSEPLHYDKATHHLVWGLIGHSNGVKNVNFFTRVLGRNGVMSLDLIDSVESISASKVEALQVLDGVQFKAGFRYADHVENDKSSGKGLTALVIGGTGLLIAKKTGILVALLVFLKKGFILVVAAIGAFFKRLFGGKKNEPKAPLVSTNDQVPPPAYAAPAAYAPPPAYAPPNDVGAQPQQGPPSDPNSPGGNNNNGGGWPQG